MEANGSENFKRNVWGLSIKNFMNANDHLTSAF